MKYIVIGKLGIKYKVPKEINENEISKLLNDPHNLILYIFCELLGLEREKELQ